ncbi:hypothetical protein [Micromonospora sp. NPDC049891]
MPFRWWWSRLSAAEQVPSAEVPARASGSGHGEADPDADRAGYAVG